MPSTPPPVHPTSTFNPEQKPALHTRPLTPIGPNLSLPTRPGGSSVPTIHGLRRSSASSMSSSPITAYPSLPVYAAQSSYTQVQQPPMFEERRAQAPAPPAPYIPPIFEVDPLWATYSVLSSPKKAHHWLSVRIVMPCMQNIAATQWL